MKTFLGTKIYMLYWQNYVKSGCAIAGFYCSFNPAFASATCGCLCTFEATGDCLGLSRGCPVPAYVSHHRIFLSKLLDNPPSQKSPFSLSFQNLLALFPLGSLLLLLLKSDLPLSLFSILFATLSY